MHFQSRNKYPDFSQRGAVCRRVTRVPTPAPQKVSRVRDGSAGALPVPRGVFPARRRFFGVARSRRLPRIGGATGAFDPSLARHPLVLWGLAEGPCVVRGSPRSPDDDAMRGVPSPWFGVDPKPEAVFNAENIAIFPFWLAMIAAPKNPVTKAVMGGYLVPFLCGFVYVYLTWYSFSDPRILEAFSTGQPDLAARSPAGSATNGAWRWGGRISSPWTSSSGDGLPRLAEERRLRRAHSLLLTLFFGPTGAISHVTTRAITGVVRGVRLDDVMAGALDAERDA